MIVLNNKDENALNQQVLASNPSAKVGKFSFSTRQFDENLPFHAGHRAVVDALVAAGCTIIVFEVFIKRHVFPIGQEAESGINSTNRMLAIQQVEALFPEVDYLLFLDQMDTNDYPECTSQATKDLINGRLTADGYRSRYQLNNLEYDVLYNMCLWKQIRTLERHITVAYYDTSNAFWYYPYKEYAEKYLSRTVLPIDTVYDESGKPYNIGAFTTSTFEDPGFEKALNFSKAIKNLSDQDWLNWSVFEAAAANIGGSMQYNKIEFNDFDLVRVRFIDPNGAIMRFNKKVGG